ncbi:MAG: coat protein [Clostridiales bacterium]|jgi:hypothetical protein|nr:coat protein [Clostridiales bacterium]
MALTRIQNVIQPDVFDEYTIRRTMELSEIITSGIAKNDPQFDKLASGANTLINMPYWEDLAGEPEVMNDTGVTVPSAITASRDVARKLAFTKSYGANALASMLSGSDPMRAVADLFAEYWARQYQKMLLATLEGVFNSDSMSEKILDISQESGTAAYINGNTFLDALQLMGDAKGQLVGVMMNSYVETALAKNDLIEFVKDSEAAPRVPRFMDKRVIVDDSMPFDTETGVGTAYLFGEGAIAWGNGSHPSVLQTETVREGMSLAGEDVLVNRRMPVLHPRGVKWTEESVTGVYPTISELKDGDNWEMAFEPKAVRIVKFAFKIA